LKVGLFFPPKNAYAKSEVNPPIGMLYLASAIRKSGNDVFFRDLVAENLSFDDFRSIILSQKPDVVGIGVVSCFRDSAIACAKIVKEINPLIKVVLGGVHSSIFPKEILFNYPEVDLVFLNEAEESFSKYVSGVPLSKISGIAYRENGHVKLNPTGPVLMDLDKLSMPAWDLCNMDLYFKYAKETRSPYLRYPHFGIIVSRGCPNKCTFCGSQKLSFNVRRHSPQYVYEMILHLRNVYGIRDIYFLDDTFAIDTLWLKNFRDILKNNPLDVIFSGQARANISREQLYIMKDMGFYALSFGVESGSQKVLNSMKKGIMINQIKNSVKLAKHLGFYVKVYLIFGDPCEKIEDIRDTVKLINSLPIDCFVWGRLMIFPGTELCKNLDYSDNWWFNNSHIPYSKNYNYNIVNYAWFMMLFGNFKRQIRFKVNLERISFFKALTEQIFFILGLGLFVNKIYFRTKSKEDLFVYFFLPFGKLFSIFDLNKRLMIFYLKLRKREVPEFLFMD